MYPWVDSRPCSSIALEATTSRSRPTPHVPLGLARGEDWLEVIWATERQPRALEGERCSLAEPTRARSRR